MNYRLAREIYGHTPLCVDRPTFSTFLNLLSDFRKGVDVELPSEKLNSTYLFDTIKAGKLLDASANSITENTNELVYVINLNGPIIKNGGLSTYGIKDLINERKAYEADPNVIGGVMIIDSGGGSGAAMELMQYDLMNSRTKPLVSLVERGGCACSAAAGIGVCADLVLAESGDCEIGSFGTMMNFAGYPNKSIDGDGAKHVTIYATESTKKNLWFEEAINNDNYDLAITEELDPFNERFKNTVRTVRPQAKNIPFDGAVYNASEVIGTLVDEIGDFSIAVTRVKELAASEKYNKTTKILTPNQTNTAMTAAELKAQHPNTYNDILGIGLAAGVEAEHDRVGSWLAHLTNDPEAVKKGIEGKGEITATARENFLVKAAAKGKLEEIKRDAQGNIITPEAAGVVETESESFYAGVLAKLIKK